MKPIRLIVPTILIFGFALLIFVTLPPGTISAQDFGYPPPVDAPQVTSLPPEQSAYPAPGNRIPSDIPQLPPSNVEYTSHLYIPAVMLLSVSYQYDRLLASQYAIVWAHDRNPVFPNYGDHCGCTDCTNFFSQILFAGGRPFIIQDWNTSNLANWWAKLLFGNTNSKTWSATDWFRDHLNINVFEFEIVQHHSELQLGDFIILDINNDNLPDHIRVITGYGFTSENLADYTDGCGHYFMIPVTQWTMLTSQHCVDRANVAWNYRIEDVRQWYYHIKR